MKIFRNIDEEKSTQTLNFKSNPNPHAIRKICTVIATSIINRIALTLPLDIDGK